jgi:hypothetical protein
MRAHSTREKIEAGSLKNIRSSRHGISVLVEDTKPSITLGLSEALLLSAITGLAYCIIYSFDSGLAAFYGLPPQFIHVDLTQLVILSILIVVLGGLPLSQAMHYDTWDLSAIGSFGGRTLIGVLTALITGSCVIYLAGWPLWYIVRLVLSSLPISLMIVLALLGRAFARVKGTESHSRRWETWRALKDGLTRPRNVRTTALYVAINAAVVLIVASRALGYYTATHQQRHFVIQHGQFRGYIVVWTIGDDITILQSYRPRLRAFGYDMVATRIDKGEPLVWHYVRTGALRNVYADSARNR